MKIGFLGISIILFCISIILSFSSTGLTYSSDTKKGYAISFIGLLIPGGNCYVRNGNKQVVLREA
ncbi:hypothetical protein ACIQYS_08425 [Psychrobacillus sp. NPDC096426]|uniref:hypothetical protein n=1 Tax=Psychrobacillus sp. NPDC096426 TaxID=3364491 RepID=UPI0037F51371